MNDNTERDPRLYAIPDTHGHAKGEHKSYAEERPLPLTARMLFLWFYHACRRGYPRYMMVADHMNYLTFEDPAAVNLVRRALKLAQAGDLYGAAETASVDVAHAAVVGEGLRRGMRFSIGSEVDNDPRSRPDAQNIVDAMRPDAMIRSVHFVQITHPVHGEGWFWPFDNPEFASVHEIVGTEQLWERYIAAVLDAIERLPGHILGHFYVPAVLGQWPDQAKLEEYEDKVLDALAQRGMAVEFNTRFLYRDHPEDEKRRYLEANTRLLRKAKERGVGIAVGSDAHSPRDQGRGFETVLEVLDQLDINEIVFPISGRLLRVALKVIRPEPEPEPPAPPPEPPKPERRAPKVTSEAPEEEAATVAEAAKPIRKARTPAKATRPPETTAERPAETTAERPPEHAEVTSAEPVPVEAPHVESPPPAPSPAIAEMPPPEAIAEPEPEPAPEPVEAAVPAAEEPALPQPVEEPALPEAAAPLSEPPPAPPKPAPKKRVPSKPAAKPVAPLRPAAKAAAKNGSAKPAAAKAKPPAKPAAKSAASSKKAAPAKKVPAKKAAAKTTAPAKKKATPKKAAPARKKTTTAKKSAPARSAPARKAPAAKKTTTKKTATKRR